ncbi:hypothetical protein GYA19_00595 [Candidatus Beckwithbacteria bacterium]|nr:hypothetical protein [Candidatus Beckwithbacteria bacterium]
MSSIEFRSPFEVVCHTHSKLGPLLAEQQEKVREDNSHDACLTIGELVDYGTRFFGQEVLFTDTDHPAHVLDRLGIQRQELGNGSLEIGIKRISEGVAQRASLIKDHFPGQVLTGVEVDILNREGTLDVSDATLASLDVVIASFHYNIWKLVNPGQKPTALDYVDSIVEAAQNPHVDIIGHPCGDLQRSYLATMKPEDWDYLLEIMAANKVAFEVNLSKYWRGGEKIEFEKQLIRRAAEKGLFFVLSLDFHSLAPYAAYKDPNKVENIFVSSDYDTNLQMFLRFRTILKQLRELGLNELNILNIDKLQFLNWLGARNS